MAVLLGIGALAAGVIAGGIALGESKYSFDSTPGRLPKDVVPTRYKIDLKPDLTTLRVQGSETIDIKVIKPTSQVVLNAVDIKLDSASLKGEAGQNAAITAGPKPEMVTLAFPHPLSAGEHALIIAFTGHINGF